MLRVALAAVFSACLLVPLTAAGQMTPVSQFRYLQCTAEIQSDDTGETFGYSDYHEATDLLPYTGNVNASAFESMGYIQAWASQTSTLGTAAFDILGEAYGEVELYENGFVGYTYATSYFDVEFTVAENLTWNLTGDFQADGSGNLYIQLYDGVGNPVYGVDYWNVGNGSLIEAGTLMPGTYTLIVSAYVDDNAQGPGFVNTGVASMDLQFRVFGTSPVGDVLTQERYLRAGPNPMGSQTTISFAGSPNRSAELDVYDLRGRLVRRLVSTGPATGQVGWDGRDNAGQQVPQGVYFVRLNSGDEVLQRKVTVVR